VIKIRRIRGAGHVSYAEKRKNVNSDVKLESKTPLRRPRIRWEDTIKIFFK
jgi:hypothetical protein